MRRFDDKIVLVTGAGSGIGLATAIAFAREGARVAVADLDGERAHRVANGIIRDGGEAIGVAVDVCTEQSCAAMVAAAQDAFGGLHVAVNNAGVPSSIVADFSQYDRLDWQRVLNVNVTGVFNSMLAEAPALIRSGGAAIVNTASMASFVAAPGMAPYIASKHAVAGLTKAFALDLIRHGIRVNAVCPGFVDTPMLQAAMPSAEARKHIEGLSPAGRLASPDEIAAPILFLACSEASYLVGALLNVDGGVVIQ